MRLVPLEKGLDVRNTNIVGLGTGPSPHCLGLGVMVMSDGIGILGPLDVDLGLLGPGTSLGLEADTTTGRLGADTSLGQDNCLGRNLGPAHLLLLSRIILSLF